jgi:predicted nucleotidyltransferase
VTEEKGAKVFSFYQVKKPHLQIDVLIDSPVPFIDAWKRSRIVAIGGEEVHVACPEDLLLLKQVASREKDREDIEVLKKIIQLEKCKRRKS